MVVYAALLHVLKFFARKKLKSSRTILIKKIKLQTWHYYVYAIAAVPKRYSPDGPTNNSRRSATEK
jgi:hypothetical protein